MELKKVLSWTMAITCSISLLTGCSSSNKQATDSTETTGIVSTSPSEPEKGKDSNQKKKPGKESATKHDKAKASEQKKDESKTSTKKDAVPSPSSPKTSPEESKPADSSSTDDNSSGSSSSGSNSSGNGSSGNSSSGSSSSGSSSSGSSSSSSSSSGNSSSENKPTETKPSHTHSYTSTTVSPTCESQGYTVHECSCGESYTDSYTDALGHSYTDTVVEPTTESEGYTLHTCSRCGYSYKDEYTDKVVETEYIDIAALEAYARQYATDSYGYYGTPGIGFNNHAGYFPPATKDITTMEEGYRLMREAVDCQYACDEGMGYDVNGTPLNVYIEPTGNPNEYLIYVFYGGESFE